jgi:hypothetical protein
MAMKFQISLKWLLTICFIVLLGCTLLPHDTYIKYQSLDVGKYAKAKWIYERIVFDPTPIDIAFFGSSHTLNAIDSEIIEQQLGENFHVVNFSLPHAGRDMHSVLVDMLLSNNRPEIILLEIQELESRDLHPGTHYLADLDFLLQAPTIINLRFIDNLVRMPLRQVSLFSKTYFPTLFNVDNEFQESHYLGSHVNYTMDWDGVPRDKVYPADEIVKQTSTIVKAGKDTKFGTIKDYLFYNANRYYVKSIKELAEYHDVPLYFYYVPSFGAPKTPYHEEFYTNLAPILYTQHNQAILTNLVHWSDPGHLNAQGAQALSIDLAERIESVLDPKIASLID